MTTPMIGRVWHQVLGQPRRLAHIYALAHSTGQLARFIIFGAFVTAKLEPNDVDIFMLMIIEVMHRD